LKDASLRSEYVSRIEGLQIIPTIIIVLFLDNGIKYSTGNHLHKTRFTSAIKIT